MTPTDYMRKRNAYWYPAVGLTGTPDNCTLKRFISTHELDKHQNLLLTHQSDDSAVLGYLSTIFWGHYSGQDRKERPDRAMGKVRLARDGKDRVKRKKRSTSVEFEIWG